MIFDVPYFMSFFFKGSWKPFVVELFYLLSKSTPFKSLLAGLKHFSPNVDLILFELYKVCTDSALEKTAIYFCFGTCLFFFLFPSFRRAGGWGVLVFFLTHSKAHNLIFLEIGIGV